MAKVGYIFEANSYDAFDADKEWMRQYGCVQVVEESVGHETLRPRWKQLMSNLERGDELVVSKFSNAVRGLRELSALIELCRIKVVRIISIHDKIDTDNKLFPDTTPAEVLAMFGALPEEVNKYQLIIIARQIPFHGFYNLFADRADIFFFVVTGY